MKNLQITAYTQHFIRQQVMPGDICIDATMGNGNDTVLLSRLAGENGRVLAFDIQKQALEHTEERLKKDDCPENYQLFLDSHENMAAYAEAETVSCITFNLGYLPGGDHSVATRAHPATSFRHRSAGKKRSADSTLDSPRHTPDHRPTDRAAPRPLPSNRGTGTSVIPASRPPCDLPL